MMLMYRPNWPNRASSFIKHQPMLILVAHSNVFRSQREKAWRSDVKFAAYFQRLRVLTMHEFNFVRVSLRQSHTMRSLVISFRGTAVERVGMSIFGRNRI